MSLPVMRHTVESTHRVSSTAIHRATAGGWTHGSLKLPVERDGRVITFAIALMLGGGDRLLIEHDNSRYLIGLVRRPVPLGGFATFLLCPECEAARRHLFLRPQRVACRGCMQLVYDGQRRHRATGYELNTRPRRALAKIRAKLTRVRSAARKLDLMARADEMLRLLDAGAERQAAVLRKMQDRAERLAKARSSPGGGSPTPMGKLPP